MENLYLAAVVREISGQILGRTVARISLAGSTLLLDLRLGDDRVLLVSVDRASPALYLARVDREQFDSGRRANDPFVSGLRKHLGSATIVAVEKDPLDRIVRIAFQSFDAGGDRQQNQLVLSLTGRSANAWLLDSQSAVVGSLHEGEHDPPPVLTQQTESTDSASRAIESMTADQILEMFFGSSSPFGPLLRREFLARSRDQRPADAMNSLVADLLEPVPLIYSRVPIEEVGRRPIDSKQDLVLSPIELTLTPGMLRLRFSSFSEAAQHYYEARNRAKQTLEEYNSARQLITHEIKKRESALKEIEADQARFDDPDKFKRFGDLILANLATARVEGSRVTVIDYYDPLQPEIEIDLAENKTLQQTAVDYFSRYQKARRAITAVAARRQAVKRLLDPLLELLNRLDKEPTPDQIAEARRRLDRLLGKTATKSASRRSGLSKGKLGKPGRRFMSSDGYEVLVGRNDRDNDVLTFRVARSLDIWMHAGDYPGSHVVISNPSRNSVPQRAITEAAELAAFYSQAKREHKVAVHYTQRKFVSKPPRAKPGLVRLSSFKTILVEPRCILKRIE